MTLTSNTVSATKAPKGATRVAFLGPPPHCGPADLTVSAGDVSFFLTNTSLTFHDIAIGPTLLGTALAVSDNVEVGRSAVFTVRRLPPGTYAIWCTIDSHAAEGMTGTLTVR